ncbi:hypothetical protein I317_05087 [Kwoniella heveanensis CBS 569]|nr:hypothetical protein I317_05087 [Kwoniella heveanensis CBS 569]
MQGNQPYVNNGPSAAAAASSSSSIPGRNSSSAANQPSLEYREDNGSRERERVGDGQGELGEGDDDGAPKRKLGKVDRGREACNECRRHKIRCHPHPDDPQHLFPCSRCERMSLGCEFAKHNRGRKRKRPGARSTEAGTSTGASHPAPAHSQPPSHPRSLGDPRFPFISMETDSHAKPHISSLRTSDRGKSDIYPLAHQMSLRHMVGEESSDEDAPSIGEEQGPAGGPLGHFFGDQMGGGKKQKVPLKGPELVDDPIRAGYLDETEARALFHLFMKRYNTPLPMLDPHIHTHDYVRKSSSFLYTAILCVTSRYLSTIASAENGTPISPESARSVHQQILVLARDHMTWAYAEATATIDVVRALVVLSINKEPDDDKAWFHISRAVLLGKELNLGRIPPRSELEKMNEDEHRRLRSRQRVWLCLFFVNSIFNMQFRQPMLILQSDPLIATAQHWLKRTSRENILSDTTLICSVELRRKFLHYRDLLVGSGLDEPVYRSALSLSILTRTMNQDWDVSSEAWMRDIIDVVGGTSSHVGKPRVWTSSLRLNLNLLIVNQTLRLPPEEQLDPGSSHTIPAFHHCLNAATTVLSRIESLDRVHLTYASDTFLHFALYAATLLSSHPYKFEDNEIDSCRRLILKTADALDAASAYPSDSPTLHAWYLRRLCQLMPSTNPRDERPAPATSLSISSDLPPSSTHNAPSSGVSVDPLHQEVQTTMPVDPALTTVMGNELDFFLGDFPWVNFVGTGTTPNDQPDLYGTNHNGVQAMSMGNQALPGSYWTGENMIAQGGGGIGGGGGGGAGGQGELTGSLGLNMCSFSQPPAPPTAQHSVHSTRPLDPPGQSSYRSVLPTTNGEMPLDIYGSSMAAGLGSLGQGPGGIGFGHVM